MKYTSKSNSKSLKLFFSSKIDTKIHFFSMDGTIIESYSYDRELKNKKLIWVFWLCYRQNWKCSDINVTGKEQGQA